VVDHQDDTLNDEQKKPSERGFVEFFFLQGDENNNNNVRTTKDE